METDKRPVLKGWMLFVVYALATVHYIYRQWPSQPAEMTPSRLEKVGFKPNLSAFARFNDSADLHDAYIAYRLTGMSMNVFLANEYGIDISDISNANDHNLFEIAIQRHTALFLSDAISAGIRKRPFPISTCSSIGISLHPANHAEDELNVDGAQGTVKRMNVRYFGHDIQLLVKYYKPKDPSKMHRQDGGPFHRELTAFAKLPLSPHFIAPICYEDHAIVFPFYEAGDLVSTDDDSNITLNLTLIAKQLIIAVHDMHLAGIVHLDLKPENLLLRSNDRRTLLANPQIMIIDFGLSLQLAWNEDMDCIKAGTKVTMSPEQLLCHRSLSAAADWWGVGATLWRLRVLWDPGMDEEERDELLKAKDHYWKHPIISKIEDFGEDFNEIVEMLLQIEPEDRQFDESESYARLLSCNYLRQVK